MNPFEPNQIVRLRNDPGKQGLVTEAEPRVQQGGRTIILEINFLTGGIRRVPADQLELVPDNQSPTDHIKSGKFADLGDIRNQIIHLKMNGHMADLLYSLEATNTEFHAYQFKPVIKMLNSPSGNIFIADEVGLGKTIEAGLIWTELKARFDFNRLMVLCPNSLRYKWDMELSEKFGLSPRVVDANELLTIFARDSRPDREQTLIGGFQSLRPRRDWQDKEERELITADKLMRFLENRENPEPLFDLLIVDESHHVRNEESTQHQMVNMLRSVSDQAVFLSATPVHLQKPDLFNQLKILDPDQFQDLREFDEIITANIPIQNARDALVNPRTTPSDLMDHLQRAQRTPILSGSRAIEALVQKISGLNDDDELSHKFRAELASDLERANLLSNVLTRTRRKDVRDFRIIRTVVDMPVEQTEIENELYRCVTKITSDYAIERDINQRFLLAMPQKMLTSSMPSTVRYWRERIAGRVISDEPDELDFIDNEEDAASQDEEIPLTQLIGDKTSDFDLAELENSDSKYKSLKEVLDEYIQLEEKVILFSTFKSTLEYLRRRLEQDGFKSLVIHGGVDDRDMVLRDFRNANDPLILLSSEVGSEGLDLQFCRVLLNYDLPWNPTRIEQRVGRIDRFGQKADIVTIINFMYRETIDQRIYERLGVRQNLIENTLGEFEAILGQEINRLTRDLIAGQRTVEEQNQLIDQTALAFQNRRIVETELEEEAAGLIAHGDYILQQVQAAQDLNRWISDTDLRIYLSGFLDRFFPQTLITFDTDAPAEFEINLDSGLRTELQAFILENRKRGQTLLTEPRRHRCRFGKVIESSRGQEAEVINQMHPLLRLAAKKFGEADTPNVRPATAITLSPSHFDGKQNIDPGDYLVVIARWSTSGTQKLEKIAYNMVSLDTGEYFEPDDAELITTELLYHGGRIADPESKFDLDRTSECASDLFDQLQESFDTYTGQKRSENYDRADFQLKSLKGQFERQSGRIRELIQRYTRAGNRGLQTIQENKLDKLQTNFDVRRDQIERNKEIYGESEDVTAIVARIE